MGKLTKASSKSSDISETFISRIVCLSILQISLTKIIFLKATKNKI
jgi:hypothetical protein